jgi:lipid-binding SYLF domain-containing protein
MRKTLIATTAAIAIAGFVAPAFSPSAFAQSNSKASSQPGGQSNYQNASTGEVNSAQELVDQAMGTVQKIKADSRFEDMLKHAKGVFIMPDLVKAAFVVGGEGAQGVLLKHDSSGKWSDPAFLTIGSISVGAQAGGKAGPAAMLLMTDKALNDFTQSNNFSLNAKSGLTIVGYSAQGQAPVGKGDIVVWSDQSGAFAGATLSSADVTQNTTQDDSYYHKHVTATSILAGDVSNGGADKLKSELPS